MEKKRGNKMTGREYKDGGNSRGDGKRREKGNWDGKVRVSKSRDDISSDSKGRDNKSSNVAAQNFIGKDSVSKRVKVRKDKIMSGRPSDGRGEEGLQQGNIKMRRKNLLLGEICTVKQMEGLYLVEPYQENRRTGNL